MQHYPLNVIDVIVLLQVLSYDKNWEKTKKAEYVDHDVAEEEMENPCCNLKSQEEYDPKLKYNL
jgi:hypothetical protein